MRVIRIRGGEPLGPQLADAVAEIARGGVVAFPTDTLYGLAADPRSEAAVARLFRLKGREGASAIALIAANLEQARLVVDLGESGMKLARTFWPGPLTIVAPARGGVVDGVRSAAGLAGVRVPAHPVARALAEACGHPVTATSANRSGEPATAVPDEVRRMLAGVPVLVDAGITPGGPPSTVIEVLPEGVREIRQGAIGWDRVLESLNA